MFIEISSTNISVFAQSLLMECIESLCIAYNSSRLGTDQGQQLLWDAGLRHDEDIIRGLEVGGKNSEYMVSIL